VEQARVVSRLKLSRAQRAVNFDRRPDDFLRDAIELDFVQHVASSSRCLMCFPAPSTLGSPWYQNCHALPRHSTRRSPDPQIQYAKEVHHELDGSLRFRVGHYSLLESA
jgi:hypothetical protein